MFKRLRRASACGLRRLATNYRHTFAFAAIGTITERLTTAPEWISRAVRDGWDVFLVTFWRETVSCTLAALVVSVAFRLCTEKGSDLVRRPARFVLFLVLGASAATVLWWWASLALTSGPVDGVGDRPGKLINFWMQTLLWGGLIGWLYLLSLQRAEHQLVFTGLLVRRALLARQLARTRLGTARAQVDPAMVAGVLEEVHRRYRVAPDKASALLGHLVDYLRLAINRGRAGKSGLDTEITMIRALVALCAAEYQMTITLRILPPQTGPHMHTGPLFLLASALLDEAIKANARTLELTLTASDHEVGIALSTGNVPIPQARKQALTDMVAQLLPAGRTGLERRMNGEANEYVVRHVCQ